MIKNWKLFNERKISYWQNSDKILSKFNLSKEDMENIFQDLMDDYPKFSIDVDRTASKKSNEVLIGLNSGHYMSNSEMEKEIDEIEQHLEQINGRLGDHGLTINIKGKLAFPYKGSLFIMVEEFKKLNESKTKELVWEFSIDEVTNILQDIIDDGTRIEFKELQWCLDNSIPNPIVVKVFSNSWGYLKPSQKEELLKNFKLVISRLAEFGFSDFWIDSYSIKYSHQWPYMEVILNDGVPSSRFVDGKKRNIPYHWSNESVNESNIHTEGSGMLLRFGLTKGLLDDIFQDISDDFPELIIYISSDDKNNLIIDLYIDTNMDDETSFKYSINDIQDKLHKEKYIDQLSGRFEELGFEFSTLGILYSSRICFILKNKNPSIS